MDRKIASRLVAVGEAARGMIGRNPESISVIRPMREGVIADYVVVEAMLRYFIGKVVGRFSFIRPEVMISVPAGVTPVEQRDKPAHDAPLTSSRSRWPRQLEPGCPSPRRVAISSSTSAVAALRRR